MHMNEHDDVEFSCKTESLSCTAWRLSKRIGL